MEYAIEISNLTKKFKDRTIFENALLKVEKGKIYGITGSNGCGKSVLFKMICGLILPQTGKIIVNKKELTKGRFPEDIGVLLDGAGLMPNETAYENLKSLAVINQIAGDKDIFESIQRVGLDPKEKKKVKYYSAGMRKKLLIAQAIMEKPSLLLLDEPMNALDEASLEQMRGLFMELKNKENVTIVMTSHNKEDIQILCDEVYQIKDKKLIYHKN